jgi:hypothetical protein
MLRYWQWLNERETMVTHSSGRSFKDQLSKMLTCYQIGLDRQFHYAHKDMITEIAVLSPDPSQLRYQHRTIRF